MKPTNQSKKLESSVTMRLDSYDVYLLIDSVQSELRQKVHMCDSSNTSRLFLLLTQLNELKYVLDTPF